MNIQCSQGDRSPNIQGNNNITGVGDNTRQKVSRKSKINVRKVAEYTGIGIVVAFLLSFAGSFLANKCSDEKASSTSYDTLAVKDTVIVDL